jgi:ADP-heptose:LPS heptosyltransferase
MQVAPRSVIVMPASRLGDMICATPIFHAIKKAYPQCRVVVAGLASCSTIHEHNSDVDEYITINPNRLYDNVSLFRASNADAAIITSPGFDAIAAFFLAAIPTIIAPKVVNGFSPYQTKSYRLMTPLVTTIEHRMKYYAPREYLRMLEPIGIYTDDTTKHVAFSATAKQKVMAHLDRYGFRSDADVIVGISVSAGNKIKEWPSDRFVELANILSSKHGAAIVFIGGAGDKELVNNTIQRLGKTVRYIDTTGMYSVDELKALMSCMDMFISVDTGPIYIAEALGVPTVDITGPIDEKEQPPIGRLHKVVHIKNRKGPELFVMNARTYNATEARRQVEEITVDSVIKAVEEILDVNNSPA